MLTLACVKGPVQFVGMQPDTSPGPSAAEQKKLLAFVTRHTAQTGRSEQACEGKWSSRTCSLASA